MRMQSEIAKIAYGAHAERYHVDLWNGIHSWLALLVESADHDREYALSKTGQTEVAAGLTP
jgi:hypothetical protein